MEAFLGSLTGIYLASVVASLLLTCALGARAVHQGIRSTRFLNLVLLAWVLLTLIINGGRRWKR